MTSNWIYIQKYPRNGNSYQKISGRILVLLFSFFLTSCQITYLLKGAYNHAHILYHREPIEKVLRRTDLTQEERSKLELTQKVRVFAQDRLNLTVGKNYSTYVQLHRPYVVWAVNASPQWKLEHYIWRFPIVGSVPYKGFPSEADAKEEALALKKKGYDTYIRGVSAYSTLGWFSDPLLSSMIRYSDEDLVNTIIHESVHATLFIKNNADFNERLASFIGTKGTELFYEELEGERSPHIENIRNSHHDQQIFSNYISAEIKALTDFYRNHPQPNLALREKQFNELKERFQLNVKSQLRTNAYLRFADSPLNNARLLLFKTYIEDLSDFEQLYQACHQDLNCLLNRVKTLESHPNPVAGIKELF